MVKGNHWWGCPNWPKCHITAAEHPDGTMMSIPANKELKALKKDAHKLAEQIWGKWELINKSTKAKMYDWMQKSTDSGHIGLMQKPEVESTITKLKTLL